jgi:hypothetical protein
MSKQFVAAAQAAGKDCHLTIVPGDHRSSKPIAIRLTLSMSLFGTGEASK